MKPRKLFFLMVFGLMLALFAGCVKNKAGEAPSQGQGEKAVAYWVDPMNKTHAYDKPGKAPCGMDLIPVYVSDANFKGIRIDPAVIQNIGVTTEEVQERALQREIRANGTVVPNEQKIYTVSAKIMGWADKLYVNFTGEAVVKGQPLLDLYSPELVSTQEEYLQALRYEKFLPGDASDEARRGARELVASTRTRLMNWDIPDSEIQSLAARNSVTKTMTLRSPDKGVVLEKMIEQGKQVEPGMLLYRIADLSLVWVMADIYQQDLSFVAVGHRAKIELSYSPGKTFLGRVAFISAVVNPEAKTAQARIEVPNTPDFAIKPGMYASVLILSPVAIKAVAVPDQAIIHTGERNVVVLALGNGYFEPRQITLGVSAGGYVQVLQGLEPGEKLVTSAQFLIDSESNLKAAISQMGTGSARPNMPGMNMPASQPTPGPGGSNTMEDMKGMKH